MMSERKSPNSHPVGSFSNSCPLTITRRTSSSLHQDTPLPQLPSCISLLGQSFLVFLQTRVIKI